MNRLISAFILKKIVTIDNHNNEVTEFKHTDSVVLKLIIEVLDETDTTDVKIGISMLDRFSNKIFTVMNFLDKSESKLVSNKKLYHTHVRFPSALISPERYSFITGIFKNDGQTFDWIEEVCPFDIIDTGTEFSIFEGNHYGYFHIEAEWY